MRRTTSSSVVSALSRGTGSSKPAASGYRWFRSLIGNGHLSAGEELRATCFEQRKLKRKQKQRRHDRCRHGPRRERCYVPCSRGAKPQRLPSGCQTKSPRPVVACQGLEINEYRLLPLDKTIVFHFYDFVLVLSVVFSRCQLYSVSLSQRKLIPNSALFILPFREFYA